MNLTSRRASSPSWWRTARIGITHGLAALSLAACVAPTEAWPDGPDDGLGDTKADNTALGADYQDCQLERVVSWVNGLPAEVGEESPDGVRAALRERGVHGGAARRIAEHLAGADLTFFTDDDDAVDDVVGSSFVIRFDGYVEGDVLPPRSRQLNVEDDRPTGAAELDHISYVGPTAWRQLAEAMGTCDEPPAAGDMDAIFTPSPFEDSHLARARDLILSAERSVDIAMYSFRNRDVLGTLEQIQATNAAREAAGQPPITVRFIFNSAADDFRDPAGTTSARLEDAGIEVRYVNVGEMHHKFMIVDGPRDSIEQATDGTVLSGSGNWSDGAWQQYDENTLVIPNHAEANLRYMREFNYLWEWSRPVVWNEDIAPIETVEITDEDIAAVDDPGFDVLFTSSNFRTYMRGTSPTFTVSWDRDEDGDGDYDAEIADRIVQMIEDAERRIYIASGHMRTRAIFEALVRKQASDPDVEIRILLDGQEYDRDTDFENEIGTRVDGIADFSAADPEAIIQHYRDARGAICEERSRTRRSWSARDAWECPRKGQLFSLPLHAAGINVRFKYYAYYWHYSFPQMHNKYLIVDDTVVTGSYNLSHKAEFETIENTNIIDGAAHPQILAQYEASFEHLWGMGEADGRLASYLDEVHSGEAFPMIFTPIALSWPEIVDLKRQIAANCSNLSQAYSDPTRVRTCYPD